ncbi:hypothetical protein SDC9_20418 [bioreactor metagenome]|uniref:Uncharacterized protein n=1 Tax=bioreactor metagenome TaxID=1076179 RepID=A0A644U6T9_9ZZZZ|nr:hypothetical protein [Methanocorpusculum sp.]
MTITKENASPTETTKNHKEAGKEVLNRPSEKSTARIIDTDALQAAHLKRLIDERSADRRPAPSIIEVA